MNAFDQLALVLSEREQRTARRSALATEYRATVVQLTISAPGVRKDGPDIRSAAEKGAALLEKELAERGLRLSHRETQDGQAGPCIFWVLEAEAVLVKEIAVGLENGYSLGRLWDFDVYSPEGLKLDRESLGSETRTCYVCRSPAAVCAGRRLHESVEVVQRFSELLKRGMEELGSKGVIE
ncbi:citrate lyase holo-[acyl-carrier protein] synthase [Treponema sp.]